MKRMSAFYITRQKKAKELVNQMESIEVENQRSKLKKLISQRRCKWKQVMGTKQINHSNFNYLKKDYQQFSLIQPVNAKQPFLDQRSKKKLLMSDRAYSSSPNMKAGSSNYLFSRKSQIQDSKVLNQKFMEFDRTIDNESAYRRIRALEKINGNIISLTRRKSNHMKKTYFQKFVPDKFNFYSGNQYSSIKGSTLSRSVTDRQMQSRLLVSKLRQGNSTLDTSQSRQLSILQHKQKTKTRKMEELDLYRSRISAKNRIKSQISQKLLPISLQKNINSLQY